MRLVLLVVVALAVLLDLEPRPAPAPRAHAADVGAAVRLLIHVVNVLRIAASAIVASVGIRVAVREGWRSPMATLLVLFAVCHFLIVRRELAIDEECRRPPPNREKPRGGGASGRRPE